MNKKEFVRMTAVVAVISLLATAAGTAYAQDRDEIRRAIGSGAHDKAISLALEALRENPADAEVRFLLARAYAYSGRWDEAEETLGRLLAEHPADTDYLVFKARLLCWRKDFAGAESVFRRALELTPRSADALAGLADLASWRGEFDASLVYCRQALDLDPNHAGALFRIGTVFLWQGNYGQARDYLARAAELEPRNGDFARALENASPLFARRTEVWLSGRNEHWSDGRPDYSDLGASVLFSLFKDRSKFVVKVNRAWRSGGHDDQFGLEAYPHLWKGAYGYVDLSVSPKADFAPLSSFHIEIYQSLLARFEVSLGARRMTFPTEGVSVFSGSAAGYFGRFYSSLRFYSAHHATGTEFTWMANLRRYFAADGFFWAGLGHGSRSFEAGSIEDILARPSWFAELGCDVYLLRNVKLRGYLARRKESGGPSSTSLALVAGYRF
jgi:YaiO family outer membrane protein